MKKECLFVLDKDLFDINLINTFKNKNIDIITPVKNDSKIFEELTSFISNYNWQNKNREVIYLPEHTLSNQFKNITGVLIRTNKDKRPVIQFEEDLNLELDGYNYSLILTTSSLNTDEIISLFQKYQNINEIYKDNKINLNLNNFESNQVELIVYYLLITLCAYNVGEIFRDYKEYGVLNDPLSLFVLNKNRNFNIELNKYHLIKKDNMFGLIKSKETFKMVRTMSEKSYNKLMDNDELWD